MAEKTIQEMLNALKSSVEDTKPKELSVENMLFQLNNQMAPKAYVEGDPSIPYANERPNVFGDVISRMTEPSTDAFQTYMKGAGSSLGQLFGGDSQEDISPTYQQIPSSVPNALRRPAAAVGDYGMGLLSGASAGFGALTGLAGGVFGQSPTGEKQLASDLMAGLEVSVPQLAGSTSQLARLARQSSSDVIPGGRKFGEMTPRMEAARYAEELGVLPTMGMQGRLGSMVESGLEASPISNPFISSRTNAVVDQIESAAQAASGKAGIATTTEAAGEALIKGSNAFANSFQLKADNLYNQLDNFIKPDDLIVAPSTINALEETLKYADDFPQLAKHIGIDKYRGLMQDLKSNGIETAIPYGFLKDIRTTYGTSIGKLNGPLSGMDGNKLNKIYGALSDDMKLAAESTGPAAVQAWSRANKFYKGGVSRIENVLKPLIKAETGSEAYKKMTNILMEGNVKQSTSALMKIRSSLPADDFNSFRATLINKLGLAKAGGQDAIGEVFSPSQFLTNYNKIASGPRKIIFGELNDEMEKLAKVVDLAKDASKDLNRSRTATAGMSMGAIAATGVGVTSSIPLLKGLAIAGAINALSGLALTSKPFLKALNMSAKSDLGPLRKIAAGDGVLSADAQSVLRVLAAQQNNQGVQ